MSDKENLDQIKADAVKDFVNVMIGAIESGFVNSNNPTLAEIHRVAEHHVKDNYGVDMCGIVESWGEDVSELCGLQKN